MSYTNSTNANSAVSTTGKGSARNQLGVVILAMIGLVTLLGGCGGTLNSDDSNSPATPVMGMSGQQATVVAMVTATANAIADQVTGEHAELKAAVLGYVARNISVPYKDVTVKVLSQDDAYATVEVHAMMRRDADQSWDENVATLQFAHVSGEWKVSKEASFVSLSGQATATAEALVANATGTAQRLSYYREAAKTADLNAVFMLSPTEGWAVGDNVILHYTGGAWEPQPLPENAEVRLNDVYMLTSSNGLAVGSTDREGVGTVLHYDGTRWQRLEDVPAEGYELVALDMSSPTNGWAVGNAIGAGVVGFNTILHYTAGKWQRVNTPGENDYSLYDVKMVSEEEGWSAGGNGTVLHLTGGEWSKVDSGVRDTLLTIAVASPKDVWALGEYGHATHYDGTVWKSAKLGVKTDNLSIESASLSSPTDGWAVARFGKLLQYSGDTWQEMSSSPLSTDIHLKDVFMLPSGEAWTVGRRGTIVLYSNGQWTVQDR